MGGARITPYGVGPRGTRRLSGKAAPVKRKPYESGVFFDISTMCPGSPERIRTARIESVGNSIQRVMASHKLTVIVEVEVDQSLGV